jgi:uncharacterized protein (TIGR02246 family)
MIDSAQVREFARRYTAAWNSGEPARVADCYAPQGSLSINGGPASVGRTAIAEAARGFMETFPDLNVRMDEVLVQGDWTKYHWTLTGTSTGPGGTGKRARISGFELWRLGKDGLIAASQGTFDSAEYQRQLEHGWEG